VFNSASASTNTFVTGGTLNGTNLDLTWNTGGSVPSIDFSSLSGETFTGNTSGDCITDLYITNLYGCSPITINDNLQHISSSATGVNSIAWGSGTTASGFGSHAEGFYTIASGIGSHAEGVGTAASGITSHAEGNNTIAGGAGSHAEGSETIAKGNYSHAEGGETIASGLYSHAEGYNTSATTTSHAEGQFTLSNAVTSHAEGTSTTASGDYSHAEGWLTTASGESSHAEGTNTIASGVRSHAGGEGSTASGVTSFIHSSNSLVTGDRSVVLGGQNITGTTDDTVYVPILNINNIVSGGTSVNNLGIDVSGNVVTGTAGGGDFLPLTGGTMTGDIHMSATTSLQFDGGGTESIDYTTSKGVVVKGTSKGVTLNTGTNILRVGTLANAPLLISGGSNTMGISLTSGNVLYMDDGTNQGSLNFTSELTAARNWRLPDASGVVALISDIAVTGLTTTGTSGPSTLVSGTLNVPEYAGGGGTDVTTATTTTIDFSGLTYHYDSVTPATGIITENLTGAKLGLIQKIYHNDVSEPTYPAGWVLMGDAIYFTSTLNIIYAEWAGGTRVEYWYVQEQ
jgi:hypothetical protein